MPHRIKPFCRLLALASLWLVAPQVHAGAAASEPDAPEPTAPVLTARVEPGEFIGEEQIQRVYVTAGTNQYGFIVPHGLRVDTSRTDRLMLVDPGLGYFLTMQVSAPMADPLLQLHQRYPGAELTDQSTTEAAEHRGQVFDLRWKTPEKVDRLVRVVWIPTGNGTLEFNLVSEPSKFGAAQLALNGLLQRLRSNETGRLQMEVGRMPDHS